MIVYDDGIRLQYVDKDGTERNCARMSDYAPSDYGSYTLASTLDLTASYQDIPLTEIGSSGDVTGDGAAGTVTLGPGTWHVWGSYSAHLTGGTGRGRLYIRLGTAQNVEASVRTDGTSSFTATTLTTLVITEAETISMAAMSAIDDATGVLTVDAAALMVHKAEETS